MDRKDLYVYITPFFPSPTRWDGAYCLDFVKTLKDAFLHLQPTPILVFVPGAGEDYEIEGVKVYRFPTRQLPSNVLPFLFRRHNTHSFLRKLKEVLTSSVDLHLQPTPSLNPQPSTLNLFDAVKVCHANTISTAIYAQALKAASPHCATILHHHDLASFGLNVGIMRHCWLNNTIHFPILRRLIEQFDIHVFCSEASRKSLLGVPDTRWTIFDDYRAQFRGLGFYRSPRIKRFIILHNGVDTSIFHPQPSTHNPQPSTLNPHLSSTTSTTLHGQKKFTLGCIGNFQELKDQLTLLEAFRLLHERGYTQLRLKLLGGDSTLGRLQRIKGGRSYQSRCKQFVQEHHLADCVEFLSEVRHEQLPDFYRLLDLFVLPSYFEGFGCVYTEAYACGVPFIACEGQGIADVIAENDRAEWLCPVHNAHALADRIAAYIDHPTPQHLTEDVSIGSVVRQFIKDLNIHCSPLPFTFT